MTDGLVFLDYGYSVPLDMAELEKLGVQKIHFTSDVSRKSLPRNAGAKIYFAV